MAACTDPEGAAFCLWQAKQHKGAQIVNEPGSVNFNSLNTRDPEGAKSFYGSVFGWETLGLGGGAEMWRLPGYGDFFEQSDPGLRKRMAETAGRSGGLRGRGRGAQPDRGRPARRPRALERDVRGRRRRRDRRKGGRVSEAEVVVPPFDAPWVRMTVITDPQGATFTASKFVPENRDLGSHGQ